MPKYPKCPKCEKVFTPDEKVSWKCSSCGSVFSCSLFKLIQFKNQRLNKSISTESKLKEELIKNNKKIRNIKLYNRLLTSIIIICLFVIGGFGYYANNQIDSLQYDIESLNRERDNLILEKQSLQNGFSNLQDENQVLNDTSVENDKKIEKLQNRVAELKSKITTIKSYREQYNQVLDEYRELNSEYEGLQHDYSELVTENNWLQSELANTYLSDSSNEYTTMVWIPATGSKYHNKSNCGNMNPNTARYISLDEAVSLGYGACGNCYR